MFSAWAGLLYCFLSDSCPFLVYDNLPYSFFQSCLIIHNITSNYYCCLGWTFFVLAKKEELAGKLACNTAKKEKYLNNVKLFSLYFMIALACWKTVIDWQCQCEWQGGWAAVRILTRCSSQGSFQLLFTVEQCKFEFAF